MVIMMCSTRPGYFESAPNSQKTFLIVGDGCPCVWWLALASISRVDSGHQQVCHRESVPRHSRMDAVSEVKIAISSLDHL